MKTAKKSLMLLLILAMLCSMLVLTASAAGSVVYGAATVNAEPSLNIRSAAGTDSDIIGSVPDDAVVVINEKTSKDWYRVTYDGVVGYVSTKFLTEVCTAEDFDAHGRIRGDYVRYRALPGPTGAILGTFDDGDLVTITGVNNGWYVLDVGGTRGYMRSDYVELVPQRTTVTPTLGIVPIDETGLAQEVVDYALQFLGCPYVSGGAGPYVFDCSGLVYYVYAQFGYELYHGATGLYERYGVYVDRDALQPGDLVFFYPFWSGGEFYVNHVGIYIGNDEFVHAPHSGDVVKVDSLSGWYADEYVGAKRIIY